MISIGMRHFGKEEPQDEMSVYVAQEGSFSKPSVHLVLNGKTYKFERFDFEHLRAMLDRADTIMGALDDGR